MNKCFAEGCGNETLVEYCDDCLKNGGFKKQPTKVTKEQIQDILDNSEYETFHRVFGKQCLVVAKLPNGFTIVGESACVDPNNYDEQIGFNLAVERIKNRIWELEGYNLQNQLYKA